MMIWMRVGVCLRLRRLLRHKYVYETLGLGNVLMLEYWACVRLWEAGKGFQMISRET